MDKMLERDCQEIFQTRSSTQEFLLSKTEPKADKAPALPFKGSDALLKTFPDLLSGSQLIETALARLNAASYFGVVLMRIDRNADDPDPPDEDRRNEFLLSLARRVEALAGKENGIWGQLAPDEFGSFFPEKNSLFCAGAAQKFQDRLNALGRETVSIGIAAFPTITFEKSQIIENAYKALAHAEFFGPGSMVTFDSVSLNISGDKLYQQGDIKGAVREFKQALLLDPSNTNVYNSLGVCYGVMGKLQEALEEFKTAVSLNPDEVMAIYNTGLVNTILGDNDKGLEYFLKAYQIGEEIFEVVFHIGKLYFEINQPKKGIEFLKKALDLNAESNLAFRYLGECYAAINRIDKAITAFTRAIKLNPNDAASLSALGHMYGLQNKDLEIAVMFCRQSVQLSPENGLFKQRLGRLYLKQNRLDEALKEFKKAQKQGQNSVEYIDQIQKRQGAESNPGKQIDV